jgi:very-short-patch-repair endonuclease
MPKGIYKRTEQHNNNIAKSLTGKKFTNERCNNISKSKTGKKASEETKKILSIATSGENNEIGLKYIHQFRIKNMKFIVDFYLPKYDLIIEVDGDNVHGNPKKFKSNDMLYYGKLVKNKWQEDLNRDNKIKEYGYKNIIRFWSSDIFNNKELVKSEILRKILCII